jgi:hypothetical protein
VAAADLHKVTQCCSYPSSSLMPSHFTFSGSRWSKNLLIPVSNVAMAVMLSVPSSKSSTLQCSLPRCLGTDLDRTTMPRCDRQLRAGRLLSRVTHSPPGGHPGPTASSAGLGNNLPQQRSTRLSRAFSSGCLLVSGTYFDWPYDVAVEKQDHGIDLSSLHLAQSVEWEISWGACDDAILSWEEGREGEEARGVRPDAPQRSPG